MDIGLTITIGLVSAIVLIWYIQRRKRMTLFERLGIPGPKPNLITGNVNSSSQQADLSLEWAKKYGNTYGIYMGAWPFLVTSDIELLKLVQIKESKTFASRAKLISDLGIAHSLANDAMFTKSGEQWKRARSSISPAFTTGKLKMMMPIIKDAIDIFLENIDETKQRTFDISPLLRRISFDINSRASFGISTGIQKHDTSLFIRSVYRSFDADSHDFLAKMLVYFPELNPLPQFLRIIRDKIRSALKQPSVSNIIENCAQIIKMRKDKPETARPDLLQGLLDASDVLVKEKEKDQVASPQTPLTENEVLANSFGFMLAGFDVTGVILSFCIHYLAEYPKIQEKLRDEINATVKGKVEYDDLINLTYLDQVISETIRMFPFSPAGVNRTLNKDFKYKDITIPKDVCVAIAIHALHMDPNYWEEPETFNPERFSQENGEINPMIYQPFGAGPRNCVGMRFAQVIMKAVIASLVQKYRLYKPDDAKDFELEYSVFLARPKNGIQVRAIPL